jgi:predicted phosphodiesterase
MENKADLILCSDMHLRDNTPTCWTEDFLPEQGRMLRFLKRLQSQHNCPVVHAGDLFHHWKPSPWLLTMALIYLPDEFYTVYGQHDLPQHNWELREKSGVYTLEKAGKIKVLEGYHFGQDLDANKESLKVKGRRIFVWHYLAYQVCPFPGAADGQAQGLLKKYKEADLIVTGDNHQSFVEKQGNKLLVNPGCMTIQRASEINYEPSVYLYFADTNSVQRIILPFDKSRVTEEHIKDKEDRDERIEAFISSLDGNWHTQLSFEENLEIFKQKNNISEKIMNVIYKALES